MMAQMFCTFHVGDLFLGIEVEKIQEVLRDSVVTSVPKAPSAIRGLINLRGQIVTAVDLRTRFGLPSGDSDGNSTVLVLDGADELLSLVVDRAGDVVEVEEDRFEEPPDTLKSDSRRLIRGAYKLEHRLLLVLDADHAFNLDAGQKETGTV
jgi:purine-binding chemotaxis protein CheW